MRRTVPTIFIALVFFITIALPALADFKAGFGLANDMGIAAQKKVGDTFHAAKSKNKLRKKEKKAIRKFRRKAKKIKRRKLKKAKKACLKVAKKAAKEAKKACKKLKGKKKRDCRKAARADLKAAKKPAGKNSSCPRAFLSVGVFLFA